MESRRSCVCATHPAQRQFESALLELQPEHFEFSEESDEEVIDWLKDLTGWGKPAVAQSGAVGAAGAKVGQVADKAKAAIQAEKTCWIQTVLNNAGGESLVVDGVYGPLTREAVGRFQAQNGLTVNGIVSPQTETALIQAALNQIARASLLPVNGIMDARTQQEIRSFQSQNNLTPDGIVGPKTRAAMVVALGGRCAVRGGATKPPVTTSDCPCTGELLDQARRRCRDALFSNIQACVLGEPIIATKAPHVAGQIASQVTAQANTLSSAAAVFSIIVKIIKAINFLITLAKIVSIASCIWEQVRSYQECVRKIDACEQECRSKGLL